MGTGPEGLGEAMSVPDDQIDVSWHGEVDVGAVAAEQVVAEKPTGQITRRFAQAGPHPQKQFVVTERFRIDERHSLSRIAHPPGRFLCYSAPPAGRRWVPRRECMAEERLQKLIARAGLCSRREADQMIQDGRVTVNGRVAEPGERADLARDHVKVDGKRLPAIEPPRYLLVYKPREVMTTCDDPEERPTVIDLVRPAVRERVFPVGRLDYHSEGLIILTNDGDLAARLAHPRFGVVREYLVKVRGQLSDDEVKRLLAGTVVEGRLVRPRRARRESVTRGGGNSWWRVEVAEGRTHEVRELFFRAGHPVQRLRRTAIGPIRDPELRPGDVRELSRDEVRALRQASREPATRRRGARAAPPRSKPRRRGTPRDQ